MGHQDKDKKNKGRTGQPQPPDGGDYTLDEILAEYGSGRSGRRGGRGIIQEDNVVVFPAQEETADQDDQPAPEPAPECESEAEDEGETEDGIEGEEPDPDKVVEFPEEESVLSAFLKDITRKADRYADHMFQESEEMDPEEVRRLEKWIPGTDQEEEPEDYEQQEEREARKLEFHPIRFLRRPDPIPEDLPPKELARTYGKGLAGMRLRVLGVFLLAVLAGAQIVIPAAGFIWLPPFDQAQVQLWGAAGMLGLGMLLSLDFLLTGIIRACKGRFGMDTLTALAAVFTMADTVVQALSGTIQREGELPYTAVVLAALFFQLHGTYHKRCGLRLACRTAASTAEPYLITQDKAVWNFRDTFRKWSGTAEGFGSQIQMDDGAQRIYRRCCPLLALGCVLLSLLSSYGVGRPEHLLWCLSATFTASASFGGALVYGRPFHKISRRLARSGAALAGWPGAAQTRRGDRVLITDGDLFPPGYVELSDIKIYGDYSTERVISYTATLIRDSGSGLTRLFHDLLRAQGGLFRTAEGLRCHEGGGLSAQIRGDQVLVGSAAFMNLMEVNLPQGLRVKNAVFCAVDGELAGIFALNYMLPDAVFPALDALMREHVGPVLATRDFNLIPAMLHQRFHLAADKMEFPAIERRRELSDEDQPHNQVLTAVLCREGMTPYAESIVGARRLRRATRFGGALVCVGGLLGLLLAYYLTGVSAYGSLSPLNLLLFQLFWVAPVWFTTSWAPRF